MSAIHCGDIDEIDKVNLVLSIAITAGLVGSYLPQHILIHKRKTSDGISPFFLLLGLTSCTNSLINIVVLQWNVLRCCAYLSGGVCFANSLGVVQMLLQWVMFTTTLVLFLIYFPRPHNFRADSFGAAHPVAVPVPRASSRGWQASVAVTCVCIVHLVVFFLVSLSFLRKSATRAQAILWANWVGGTGAVLSTMQYLPQLVTTLRRRSRGSLSLATLAIQAPGSFILAYSIAVRPGVRWSSWLLFVVTGALQLLLLLICLGLASDRKAADQVERAHRGHSAEQEEAEALLPPFDPSHGARDDDAGIYAAGGADDGHALRHEHSRISLSIDGIDQPFSDTASATGLEAIIDADSIAELDGGGVYDEGRQVHSAQAEPRVDHCADHVLSAAHRSEGVVAGLRTVVRGLWSALPALRSERSASDVGDAGHRHNGRDADQLGQHNHGHSHERDAAMNKGSSASGRKAETRHRAWLRERRLSAEEDERTRLLTEVTDHRPVGGDGDGAGDGSGDVAYGDESEVVRRHGPRVDEPQYTTAPSHIHVLDG